MSNTQPFPAPLVPGPDDGLPETAEMEVGDETRLDPDADADQVNSAEADRRASGSDHDEGLLGGDPVDLP